MLPRRKSTRWLEIIEFYSVYVCIQTLNCISSSCTHQKKHTQKKYIILGASMRCFPLMSLKQLQLMTCGNESVLNHVHLFLCLLFHIGKIRYICLLALQQRGTRWIIWWSRLQMFLFCFFSSREIQKSSPPPTLLLLMETEFSNHPKKRREAMQI